MSKEEKDKIKRELILWYESGWNEKIGNALKKLTIKERRIIEICTKTVCTGILYLKRLIIHVCIALGYIIRRWKYY